MAFYDDMAALSVEMAEEFGAPCTLIKNEGEYDTATSEVDNAPASHEGYAIRTDYKLEDIDGTMIQFGDIRLFLAPKTTAGAEMPKAEQGDKILFDGSYWEVIRDDVKRPATVTLGHFVQARKG